MPFQNPDHSIISTKSLIETGNRSELQLNANGGNSILIVCEPEIEYEYIQSIKKLMGPETYQIIDLNNLLSEFVSSNKSEIEESFELSKASINQIFKKSAEENNPDLFDLILQTISKSYQANKIPVLIHSGALYGSGIENIHIMENEVIMKATLPLIVLYPAIKDGDKLLFLGKRPASKYRCMIVNESN